MTDTDTYLRKAAELMGLKGNHLDTPNEHWTNNDNKAVIWDLRYHFDWREQVPLWQKVWSMVCLGAGSYTTKERSNIDMWTSEYEFHLLSKSAEECFPKLFPLIDLILEHKESEGWILTSDRRPSIGDSMEFSDDGQTVEGTLVYLENRICMMAGIAGGHGYFGEGFATDGLNGCDYGLICDDPKYWRHSK